MWTYDVAHNAREQLIATSRLPIVGPHVAAMPDVHLGLGATVGSVIPTRGAVIPAAVGVDIGCGMLAVEVNRTTSQLPDSLGATRGAIERALPVGMKVHDEVVARRRAKKLEPGLRRILERTPEIGAKRRGNRRERAFRSIGTLGGGNHFVELQESTDGRVWVMLHSGSRGIGARIGECFIAEARKRIVDEGIDVPDRNLAWLEEGCDAFERYIEAVGWAQDYARENRLEMLEIVMKALRSELGEDLEPVRSAISCHHNYVAKETHGGEQLYITRKGAIRAGQGELGIVPGSMGARSYIVRGKGNAAAFESAAHGAGRRMSRSKAKEQFTRADLEAATQGIECRKDDAVVDEIPQAYKDIDEVMENQQDLVEVVTALRQLVCVKG